MLAEGVLFLVGLFILVAGADRAVRAAGELALSYGVSPFFIGVTVVSIGTSIPEMTTSIYGSLYGAGDIVVGNIIGSETAQITLAVAVVAMISPIVTGRRNVLVYGSAMLLAMSIMLLTLDDGVVVRSEGVLMMLAYVQFIYILYSNEGGQEIAEEVLEEPEEPAHAVLGILVGLAMVIIGGHLLISNGIALATLLGVPEFAVGLLTGLGTSVPEIVVAGIAARKGTAGISVGSLLGSNITDPVFSLGVGALVGDIAVADPAGALAVGTYMIAVSVVVLTIMYWRRGIDRKGALLCLAIYFPSYLLG